MRSLAFVAACLILPLAAGCAPPAATASVDGAGAGDLVVRRDTFRDRLVLTGELKAVRSDNIIVPRTPVWRVPIRWMETDGAWVEQGQKVLELDNSQFTGDLAQKELAAVGASNDLARKRAEVAGTLAEKEFALEEKRITLEKARLEAAIPEEIRPQREYQEDQLELAKAEAEHEKAVKDLETTRRASEAEFEELEIAVRRAGEEIETARKAIDSLTLTAPRAGILIVAEDRGEGRKYQVGDNVWVGLAVMRIPDLSAMKVEARLSDVDDGKIAIDMPARFTLDIDPERSYEGRVTELTPVAQEDSNQSMRRSFRVTLALDGSNPEVMRPGMSVRAEILPRQLDQALVVPRASLDWSGDQPRALLADGSSVDVTLGPCNPQECVVVQGLQPGTRLRTRG